MMKPTAVLLALSLLAPAAAPAAAAIKNPDSFVYATIGDPESFDPAWSYDTASHNILANTYEYLLAFKGGGTKLKDLEPMLATKVPSKANKLISADGLTYTFPIRKGVKFHDGSTLTPEDVRYSLLRFMLLDRDAGPSSLLLEPILGVPSTREKGALIPGIVEKAFAAVTVEGDNVVIKLPKPFAPFLTVLAGHGEILNKAWCAKNGQWDGDPATAAKFNNPKRDDTLGMDRINGTGAFKLVRYDKSQKQTTLARHDGYWRGPAKLKSVIIKVIDEFATRKLMLQAGDADSVYGPQMFFPQLQNLEGVQLIDELDTLDVSAALYFAFNINPVANQNLGSGKLDGEGIPPDFFSDKDVRKAFAYSIDRDAYVKDIQRGKGRPGRSFIPSGLLGYRSAESPYKYDPKKAEEHFKKAWGGKLWQNGFKLAIIYNTGSAPAQVICQMIKRNIESINPKFKVDVRVLQWSSFLEQKQAGKLPIFTGAWAADYPDPHNFAFPILHSQGYFPTGQRFKNEKIDALIEKAVRELDDAKRAKMYADLHKLWDEEVPSFVIAEGYRYRAQRSWVKGFVFKPTFPDMPYGSYYYDLHKAE
jgi:peptide/nickel transport system substrate-binding protein